MRLWYSMHQLRVVQTLRGGKLGTLLRRLSVYTILRVQCNRLKEPTIQEYEVSGLRLWLHARKKIRLPINRS